MSGAQTPEAAPGSGQVAERDLTGQARLDALQALLDEVNMALVARDRARADAGLFRAEKFFRDGASRGRWAMVYSATCAVDIGKWDTALGHVNWLMLDLALTPTQARS